jgi:hypothetical protein
MLCEEKMTDHSYNITQQEDGRFCVRIFGGYIEIVKDCPSWNDAEVAGQYAIAKNKEYIEEDAMTSTKPSSYGAILGDALALIAAAGRKDLPEGASLGDACLTCAFREGTLPNRMGGTAKQALDCVLGIDRDRFACHHGMKDGEPKRLCAGYLAAMIAPFSFVKEVLASAHKDLAAFNDSDADPVRDDYVRWLSMIDPDGKMDVYQIARAYALRDDLPKPITEAEKKLAHTSTVCGEKS